jgi:hypothetical protein
MSYGASSPDKTDTSTDTSSGALEKTEPASSVSTATTAPEEDGSSSTTSDDGSSTTTPSEGQTTAIKAYVTRDSSKDIVAKRPTNANLFANGYYGWSGGQDYGCFIYTTSSTPSEGDIARLYAEDLDSDATPEDGVYYIAPVLDDYKDYLVTSFDSENNTITVNKTVTYYYNSDASSNYGGIPTIAYKGNAIILFSESSES